MTVVPHQWPKPADPAPRRPVPRVAAGEIAAYLIVIALGLALRYYRLETPSLRGDEAFGFFFAQQPIPAMLRAMVTTEPHPPLFYLVFRVWQTIAGPSEFSLRFFSLAFGVLTLPLVGALGRRLFGRPAGLIAAAWLAIAPLQVWNSQDARMFTLGVALTLAATILQLDQIRAAEAGRPPDRRAIVAYAALMLTALFSLYHTIFVLIAQNLAALVWLRRPRSAWAGWIAGQALIGLAYLPWLVLARRAFFGHGGNGTQPGLWGGLVDGFASLTIGETAPPESAGVLTALGAVVLVVATVVAARRSSGGALFAGIALIVPAGIVIGLALLRPVYQPRYLIPAQPALAVLFGAGLAGLIALAAGRLWARRFGLALTPSPAAGARRTGAIRAGAAVLAVALAGFLIVSSGQSLAAYWHDPRFVKASGWRDAARHIRANWQSGDFVVLNVPDPAFGYYFPEPDRSTLLPAATPVDPVATGAALARLAGEHPRIWLIPFKSPTFDAEGFVEAWLERNAHLTERHDFENVRVRLFETARPGLAAASPIGARFDGGIELAAYRVDPRDAAGTIRLTLYWRANERVAGDWTVFVHVVDAAGQPIGQRDNPPRGGTYPTSRWLPGETIEDSYAVPVEANAVPDRLRIGLYDPASGRRRPLIDGTDSIAIELCCPR